LLHHLSAEGTKDGTGVRLWSDALDEPDQGSSIEVHVRERLWKSLPSGLEKLHFTHVRHLFDVSHLVPAIKEMLKRKDECVP